MQDANEMKISSYGIPHVLGIAKCDQLRAAYSSATKRNFRVVTSVAAAAAVTALLTGCASNPLTASKFSGSSNLSPETVQAATVIKTLPISIKHNSQVTQNAGLGAGAGGIAGYLLGGRAIAAIAGAVGGGAIGAVVTPSTIRGTDIFVKFASGQMMSIPEVGIVHFAPGEAVYVMTSAHGHYRVEPANQPAPVAAPTAKAKS